MLLILLFNIINVIAISAEKVSEDGWGCWTQLICCLVCQSLSFFFMLLSLQQKGKRHLNFYLITRCGQFGLIAACDVCKMLLHYQPQWSDILPHFTRLDLEIFSKTQGELNFYWVQSILIFYTQRTFLFLQHLKIFKAPSLKHAHISSVI